jgi:hypothetical protein
MAVTKSTSKNKPAKPPTVAAYLAGLPADQRPVATAMRKFVRANIAEGYTEFIGWGGINWGIPLSEFSNTYNGHPLSYVVLAPNKNNFSLHLLGAYFDPKQTAFMKDEFKKAGKRFDMGMGCLRFKTLDGLELKSLAKVIGAVSKTQFLTNYKKLKGL